MKKLLPLLFVVSACSSMTEGKFKKQYFLKEHKSSDRPAVVHAMLTEKMTKCYTQSEYPLYEKTISEFDPATESGTVSYKIDNQSSGPKMLVLAEVLKDGEGSVVKVYAHGDVFRPTGVYKHQIQKWVDGMKVDCHGHGEI